MTVVTLAQKPKTTLVQDLRKLADEIEAGTHTGQSGIVVIQDRAGTIQRTLCGDQISYSAWMGLLSYVQHMLYRECRAEAGDG